MHESNVQAEHPMGRRDIPSPPKNKSLKDQKVYRSQVGNDNKDFTSFQEQLQALGLELRDVPGDGNCLFRALGDQLDGHSHNHLTHRRDVCEYMLKHREDFEPFIEDEVPFQRYIDNLSQSGTYAGNDAIVAFARLHEVVIVIHQLNSPLWNIKGTEQPNARQLHIAYHNGVHYSSVRKIGEDSQLPANIRLPPESKSSFGKKSRNKKCTYDEDEISAMVLQVATATGSNDMEGIYTVLEDNDFDVEATIDVVFSLKDLMKEYGKQKDVGLWGPNGSGTRLFGNAALDTSSEFQIVPAQRILEASSRKTPPKYQADKAKRESEDGQSKDKRDTNTTDSKDFSCLNL